MTGANGSDGRSTPVVAIVGAGMSGLCMAIKLKRAGIDSFSIYEKAGEIGGTWRDNTYPGLTCDVPSRFYSYSFAPNPDWTREFAPGPEIWRYFDGIAATHGLRAHVQLNKEVTSARWEDRHWRIRTADGDEARADFLVAACGVLHHPRYPDIEGRDSFAGATFHSARWDHSVDLRGKRIGLIGTGSTGVQIATEIAASAGRLHVFQRTPQWIAPVPNRPFAAVERAAMRRWRFLNHLSYRLHRAAMELVLGGATVKPGWRRRLIGLVTRLNLRTVRDPVLRAKLTPDYEPMCKRLVMSAGFYRAVQRDNVEVVTEAIDRIEPAGVVTRDGRLRELDVLVFATGFDAHAFVRPMELVGAEGVTLAEAWEDGPRAYRTVAIPGFPNFFMLMGPHSPIGNQSLIAVAETQADYVMRWIRSFRDGGVRAMAPTGEATERFNREMREAMPGTVWTTGCSSWYLDRHGLPALWPWTPKRHREMLREPVLGDFELSRG